MFAVLHVPDFPLAALLRAEDAFTASFPAALIAPFSRPARILACTDRARALGVEIGQTTAQALARYSKLRLLTPRPDAESEATAGLLAAAFSVSPQVELTAPGLCTLNIVGVAPAEREPALRRALAQLSTLGLPATAGAASTPLLARYAARRADPLFIPDNERAFLAALPLEAAEPPPDLVPILAGWSLRTLGDLTDLSKASVTQRLGPAGLALWERAAGQTTRPLRLLTPEPSFSAAMDCEHEMETLEPLLFLFRRFVDRLALDLQNAALAAAALRVTLALADDTRLVRELRLPEPSTRPEVLFGVLQTWLESTRTAAAITGVRLDLTPARVSARQPGFFNRALRDPHRFAETLARVSAIVGADRVGTPVLQNTHRPDAFTLEPPAAEIPVLDRRGFVHPPQGLVLRRYRPPRPAIVELAPDSPKPLAMRTPDIEGEILALDGPWHSSGNWWQADQAWRREEWDVQLDTTLYRLIRTAAGWLLEGEYD